jgi:hypothetical protein
MIAEKETDAEDTASHSASSVLRSNRCRKETNGISKSKTYWRKRLEDRHYDIVKFRNGYARNAPEMLVEFRGVRRDGRRRNADYADSGPSRTVIPTHRGQRSGDRGQFPMSV